MTTPEQGETQNRNEPKLVESDGYLVRGFRRLAEGLGPYVHSKTHAANLLLDGTITPDVHRILQVMLDQWGKLNLDTKANSLARQLFNFRNSSWAHLRGYNDYEVLNHLNNMSILLSSVSAETQSQEVVQMRDELNGLLASQSAPVRQQPASEFSELQRQINDSFITVQISGLLESRELAVPSTPQVITAVAGLDATIPFNWNIIDPGYFINRAEVAFGRGDFDNAIGYWNRAIDLNPDLAVELNFNLATAYNNLGTAHDDKGEYDQAIAYYNAALKHNPDLAVAYENRGTTYHNKGEYDQAITDIGIALKHDPDNVEAYNSRGTAYALKGEYDQAITDFDAALKHDPENVEAYRNRGVAYNNKGEYDQAITDLGIALKHDPDNVEAYRGRGLAHARKGEYGQSIADFDAALKHDPDNVEIYNNRGFSYFKKGGYDQAIADFDAALKHDPDYMEAYHNRGLAYARKGEYDQAIADFNAALERNPHRATYYLRGYTYFRKEEYNQAIIDFERVIALEPDSEIAESAQEHIERAIRLRDAITKYNQDIEDDPKDAANWYVRGIHYLDEMGDRPDYDRAVADFSEAIRLEPENAAIRYDRGRAYYDLGDYEAAILDYSRAIDLKPDDHIAWCERGRAHQRRDEHRSAITDFDHSLTLNPNYSEAYQLRSISHARLGNRELAQADFEMWRGLA